MKSGIHLFVMLGVLFMTDVLSAATQDNINLLPNPGFEVVTNGWADGWMKRGEAEAGSITMDSETRHSGKYSVHISINTNAAPKVPRELGISQALEPVCKPERTFTCSVWAKKKNIQGRAILSVYEYPAPIHSSRTKMNLTTNWTRFALTFTTRVDVAAIHVNFNAGSQGEIWLDDFKLEEGSTPTAYTDEWLKAFYSFGRNTGYFPVPFDYDVNMDYVIPHPAPAMSLKTPAIPVLFCMYWVSLRHAVELAQRVNLKPLTVAINAKSGRIHEKCALRLRSQLEQKPRVMVIDVTTWNLLMSDDISHIEKQVRDGMGLVFHNVTGGHAPDTVKAFIAKARPRPDSPGVFELDRGVIVVYVPEYNTYRNTTFGRESNYDRAVRTILTAAQISCGQLTLKLEAVPTDQAAWNLVVATNKVTGLPPSDLRIRAYPSLPGNPRTTLNIIPVPAVFETNIPFTDKTSVIIDSLPNGDYFMEATARDTDGSAQSWALLPMTVKTDLRFLDSATADLALHPDRDTTIKVCITNEGSNAATCRLQWRLADTESRLLAPDGEMTAELAPGINEKIFPVRAAQSAAPMATLRVTLERDGRAVDARTVELSAEALLREPDFRFAVYRDFMPGCKALGADTVVGSGREIALHGMRIFPWGNLMPFDDKRFFEEDDSIANPATLTKISGRLQAELRGPLPFHTVGLMLIDEWENAFRTDAHHLGYFKKYLLKTYGNIRALNESWGINLKSFDEVSFNLCSEAAIRDKGASPVPWADMQSANEQAVAGFIEGLNRAAREVDTDARLGFSGTRETRAKNGMDWWQLMQVCRIVATYGGVHTRFEEWFRQPGTRMFQWSYPTGNNIARSRHDPWRDALRQRDGYLHYGGNVANLFMPDFSPFPAATTIGEEIAAIRRGPGPLLRGARRDDFGITILYSMSSYHASFFPTIKRTGQDFMNDILHSFDSALNDARLDARFVSYAQLAAGQIKRDLCKALILPYALAMSDAEVKAVIDFVNAGGVVLADVRPAVYNEHCKLRPSGALDNLFGVAPGTNRPAMQPAIFKPDERFAGKEVSVRLSEPELKPAGAVAHGMYSTNDIKAPVVLCNTVGAGKAILLNFSFPEYRTYRAGGVGGEVSIINEEQQAFAMRDFLVKLLDLEAGVRPAVSILGEDGIEIRGIEGYTYRDGNAVYYGFVPRYTTSAATNTMPAKLKLSAPAELYDVRAGKYLGRTDAFDIRIQEAHAQLYALMPYKVVGLDLSAPASALLGKTIEIGVKVRVDKDRPGRHVIVVEAKRPDGTLKPWDCFTFEAPSGEGRASIPLAFNDPAGVWKITLTDAATGVRTDGKVQVTAQ